MADIKIKVLSPVEHDGKRVEPGKTLTLPEEIVEALEKAGAVERAAPEKPAKEQAK
jgi:hypothetical protein